MNLNFINPKFTGALLIFYLLHPGFSQASSAFDSQVALNFYVDSITNHNASGDLSGLTIQASFQQADAPASYALVSGDGELTANNPSINPTVLSLSNPFQNAFSVIGNATDGAIQSSTVGWYSVLLTNTSLTDVYSVDLSLGYHISANTGGEFADSDVILDVYSDTNPDLGQVFINANTINPLNALADDVFSPYQLDIPTNSSLGFYVDVTINATLQASPVPLPTVTWCFLLGVLGFLGLAKRNRT